MRRTALAISGSLFVATVVLFACVDDSTSPEVHGNDSGTTANEAASPSPSDGASASDSNATVDARPNDTDAGFTPAALGSRLVLWLEGDAFTELDGGAKWQDKSGSGNDAWQDAAARTPMLVDASTDGAVNGHGVVRFSGNQFLSIDDKTSLQWSTSDFGFYVVMRHHNGPAALPAYGIVYGKWTDKGPEYPGFFMWANYPGAPGYTTRLDSQQALIGDGGQNDDVTRIVGARRVGADYELRVGGNPIDKRTDASVPDGGAFDAPGLPAFIGGRPAPVQQLQGDIAEILAVKGTLTDAEQSAIEAYLKTKYGL